MLYTASNRLRGYRFDRYRPSYRFGSTVFPYRFVSYRLALTPIPVHTGSLQRSCKAPPYRFISVPSRPEYPRNICQGGTVCGSPLTGAICFVQYRFISLQSPSKSKASKAKPLRSERPQASYRKRSYRFGRYAADRDNAFGTLFIPVRFIPVGKIAHTG